jgi:hypothetical protein
MKVTLILERKGRAMATYTVRYEMKNGNTSTAYAKTINCETEHTAIQIAESQGNKDKLV